MEIWHPKTQHSRTPMHAYLQLASLLFSMALWQGLLGQPEGQPQPPFFHRQGQQIINPDGQPFLIKGVNVSCWLYQENYVLGGAQTAQKVTAAKVSGLIGQQAYKQHLKSMMDTFLTPEDLALMEQMGINSVRLGFDAALFNDETTTSWFFESLDRLMPACRKHNIAVIPIMMVPPKAPDNLWCTGYVKGDTLLWDSPAAQQRTIEIWAQIARHFRDETMILGYDLLGEPALKKNREKEIIDLYRRISAAIRTHDPNHIIIYEGNKYATDLSVLARYDHLLDANGCYSFHLYTWFGLNMKSHLPKFMLHAGVHDRPVFCGEWGINKISAISEQVNLMNAASDMDGWTLYMWKALELPTGPAEKKRAPYYGNWFFIPFEKLHMSLITFKIDDETRDVIDWMSDVKNTRTPAPEEVKKALATLAVIVNVNQCKFNPALIQTVGFTTVNR